MPGLLRAAEWNDWSEHETLIQLVGHLRGRALQEWRLLTARENKSLEEVTALMRSRLDPSSRALAAQDFRHASQQEGESVADFIRRLEQICKLVYRHDGMSDETRGTLLHGQLRKPAGKGVCRQLKVITYHPSGFSKKTRRENKIRPMPSVKPQNVGGEAAVSGSRPKGSTIPGESKNQQEVERTRKKSRHC